MHDLLLDNVENADPGDHFVSKTGRVDVPDLRNRPVPGLTLALGNRFLGAVSYKIAIKSL